MQVRAAEITAVDKEILVSEAFSGHIRTSCESVDTYYRSLCLYVYDFFCDITSQHILYPEFQRLSWSEDIDILAIVRQREAYVGTRQGHADELCHHMLELYVVRLEELASRRHIVKKVAYAEVCASRGCDLLCGQMLRISEIDLTADLVLLSSSLQRNLRHCRDRSQSLTAESECEYVMEVFSAAEL